MRKYKKNHERIGYRHSLFDIVNNKEGEYPPLFDIFKLGDRVKRNYIDKDGNISEYAGIILAICKDKIEIYWDTKEGKYKPDDMDLTFTNCKINEIFKGTKNYSPIKKE